jgi:ATP-dependent protease ClpP protease subunit
MKMRTPKERNLFFTEQVDQKSISELTKNITSINEDDEELKIESKMKGFEYNPKPIKIYIDSYGGLVYQALGLI